MKVTYIYHSCFAVELDHTILLFDYFKGEVPEFDREKELYVFSSHMHHDHFNLAIFEVFAKYPKVTYVLSSDIKLSDNYLEKNGISPSVKEQIVTVAPNKSYDVNGIKIETLKSTDQGVAFLVSAEERSIYHAGDLNWWHWSGESADYNEKMEKAFKKQIDMIEGRAFDVSFLPADTRQEDCFWWGFDYFMKQTDTKVVFPMHFWEDYTIIDRLEKLSKENGYEKKLYSVRGEGQEWEIQI
ncbi:MBL fold metallo-hydrolase [Konateibacter massiliensis]|uniref:MBL fold metallo-hydrolase n=1 Tax=Konateibacter massiliensis TaxID=2002841 RepID=UPI000C153799|nr:MBL fold metallo-hydrolase [Konateibacter massiliensis]